MAKRDRPANRRLHVLVSFAAGFLLAALTVQRNCGFNAEELQTLMASNASSSDFLDDREQVTEQVRGAAVLAAADTVSTTASQQLMQELSQGALFTMSKTEQLEQLKFCQENQHSPSDTQLQAAGFAYVRADGIQPGLGAVAAPGHNVSMWVYQGTSKHHDIVSSSIEQGGAWEPHETREVVTKLERFQQVTCHRQPVHGCNVDMVMPCEERSTSSNCVQHAQARGLSKEQVYFIDIGGEAGPTAHFACFHSLGGICSKQSSICHLQPMSGISRSTPPRSATASLLSRPQRPMRLQYGRRCAATPSSRSALPWSTRFVGIPALCTSCLRRC